MTIVSSIPTTLEEMLSTLEPLKTNGIFDNIVYDDPDVPAAIECSKGGIDYLHISRYSTNAWRFSIVVSEASGGLVDHIAVVTSMAICKGGAYIYGSDGRNRFVIAKDHSGQPAFIIATLVYLPIEMTSPTGICLYPRSKDDNTALQLYVLGKNYVIERSSSYIPDRTILEYIPICGDRGSTGYFETVFVRTMFQYVEDGEQIIDGKKYGCIDVFAFIDEADE